ncbi:transcriptional repressor [Micromonospora sp. WMMD882]|uniref:Fur family transcriptional regulator n=1 Tax=Micromonospora sp. WMMD882 TaxID=3015151 RepID=UPI00248C5902|nr:transcriptional repressor [Micromonospora sp. WMMD882]WBB82472.1 transcriptional repressor [Micromonospora sp. WMMD882]
MDRLRRAGLRATLARRGVLEALGEAAGERRHLSATQVHQRLTGQGLTVELSTVHRVLASLVDLGVAHSVPVGAAATFGLADQPHHHAVCQGCGVMRQLPVPAVADSVAAARVVGVEVDPHGGSGGVVVYGRCAPCRTSPA